MIPWVAFNRTYESLLPTLLIPLTFFREQTPDWRADLNEYNLHHHIDKPLTQLRRGLDSPMLEQAHERQFAISQLGTRSVGFEAEHSKRMEKALKTLDMHFTANPAEETCHPTSPHIETLADFRIQSYDCSPLPPLQIYDQSQMISPSPSPPRATGSDKTSRSFLALQELMNPAPSSSPPPSPPSSSLKRKFPNDYLMTILADDNINDSLDLDSLRRADFRSQVHYSRSKNLIIDGSTTRTHRIIRMRRPRSSARHHSSEARQCADHFDKEGQLRQDMSRSRMVWKER